MKDDDQIDALGTRLAELKNEADLLPPQIQEAQSRYDYSRVRELQSQRKTLAASIVETATEFYSLRIQRVESERAEEIQGRKKLNDEQATAQARFDKARRELEQANFQLAASGGRLQDFRTETERLKGELQLITSAQGEWLARQAA